MRFICIKRTYLYLLLAVGFSVCRAPCRAEADAPRTEAGTGIAASGQHGIYRLTLPESKERHLSLVLNGGYAFTESMGPVSGTHHRMQGGFAIGGSPFSWLGISLGLDGYRDTHPSDDDGEDSTAVGVPSLLLRGGHYIGEMVQLGAQVKLYVPGAGAPSLQFSATTVESSLLFAVSPKKKAWSVLMSAGYRFDNTGNIAPLAETLRPGDRISLNFSDFNTAILGMGANIHIKKADLFAEITADVLVGNGAPTFASPIRVTAGGRYAVIAGLDLFLIAEPLVSKRPPVNIEDPYAPTPPRLAVLAGLAYTFGFPPPKVPRTTPIAPLAIPAEKGPATTTLSGKVQDEDGYAVGGAAVSLVIADQSFLTETNADGAYTFKNLPIGQEGRLTVETDGFTPLSGDITLSAESITRRPEVLVRPPLESVTQLKGLVRSIEGIALDARITILPGNLVVHTDKEGYFILDLDAGTYTVKITAQGYRSQKKKVQIETEGVTILNVDLTPSK